MRVDLGGGRFFECDLPPAEVLAAVRRVVPHASNLIGQDLNDIAFVVRWLDEQHEKYGGVKNMS